MSVIATTKQISQLKKVDGLPNDEVKSHLQVRNLASHWFCWSHEDPLWRLGSAIKTTMRRLGSAAMNGMDQGSKGGHPLWKKVSISDALLTNEILVMRRIVEKVRKLLLLRSRRTEARGCAWHKSYIGTWSQRTASSPTRMKIPRWRSWVLV